MTLLWLLATRVPEWVTSALVSLARIVVSVSRLFPNSPPKAATQQRAIFGLAELQMPPQDWDVPFESGLALTTLVHSVKPCPHQRLFSTAAVGILMSVCRDSYARPRPMIYSDKKRERTQDCQP